MKDTLDLHGIRHGDVPNIVEDFILNHSLNAPTTVYIITGNSDKMKQLCYDVMEKHNKDNTIKYYNPSLNIGPTVNIGTIIVQILK